MMGLLVAGPVLLAWYSLTDSAQSGILRGIIINDKLTHKCLINMDVLSQANWNLNPHSLWLTYLTARRKGTFAEHLPYSSGSWGGCEDYIR